MVCARIAGLGQPVLRREHGVTVVSEDIAGGQARVGIEPGDPHRVIVVPHHPRGLLVGVVIVGAAGRARQCGLLGCELRSGRIGSGGVGRGEPCLRSAIADPRNLAAVQVDRGAVVRAALSAHDGAVDRQEVGGGQMVGEAHMDRPVAPRQNQAAQMARVLPLLRVAPKPRRPERLGQDLVGEFTRRELVVVHVLAQAGRPRRCRKRNIHAEAPYLRHELRNGRAHRHCGLRRTVRPQPAAGQQPARLQEDPAIHECLALCAEGARNEPCPQSRTRPPGDTGCIAN
jgi:hypothetical protein